MIIAVDASGGEYAPHEIVKGPLKRLRILKSGSHWWVKRKSCTFRPGAT